MKTTIKTQLIRAILAVLSLYNYSNTAEPKKQEALNKDLLVAAKENNIELIKKLVHAGANIETQDSEGNTPLHLAVKYSKSIGYKPDSDEEIHDFLTIDTLITLGAHIWSKNFYYNTPYSTLASREEKYTMLSKAYPTIILPTSCLNAVISFEHESKKLYGSIDNDLEEAFYAKVPIICHINALKFIAREDSLCRKQLTSSTSIWSLFIDKSNTFAVLLPTPYKNDLLKTYDLTASLSHINPQDIHLALETIKYDSQESALINHFKELFDGTTTPKHFLLIGHGSPEPSSIIASITMNQFAELLGILGTINTQFLCITSCFSSGPNLIKIQEILKSIIREQQKSREALANIIAQSTTDQPSKELQALDALISKNPISFAIVIQTTSDVALEGSNGGKREFFNRLDIFLKDPTWYFGKPKTKKAFAIEEVLDPLFSGPTSLMSVRFPGKNSFFRAVPFYETNIITYIRAIATQIATPKNEKPTIRAGKHVKYLQIYPCDLSALTIEIEDKTLPIIISKIDGPAIHAIGTLNIKGNTATLNTIIKNCFLNNKLKSNSHKTWFIQHLIISEKRIKNLIIDIEPINDIAIITYQSNNTYYKIITNSQAPESSYKPITITHDEYNDLAKQIIIPRASPEALRAATGGNISPADQENLCNSIIEKLKTTSGL